MWPHDYINPMIPYFQDAKAEAANVPQPGEKGIYTIEMFQEDFPQFFKLTEIPQEEPEGETRTQAVALVPEPMLQRFIDQANDSVVPSRWGSMWRYAAGLYTAHFSAMYLKTYSNGSDNAAQAANNAAQIGVVKTASMGDTAVSYDNSAITAGTEKWGVWNATQYGSQLVTMARMIGIAGMYAI